MTAPLHMAGGTVHDVGSTSVGVMACVELDASSPELAGGATLFAMLSLQDAAGGERTIEVVEDQVLQLGSAAWRVARITPAAGDDNGSLELVPAD